MKSSISARLVAIKCTAQHGSWTSARAYLSTSVTNPNDLLNLRNFANITPHLEKEIQIYSNKKEIPVSLKSLMETGKGDKLNRFDELIKGKYAPNPEQHQASQKILIQVACFLHRELPVRLAHRAVRLESSPLFAKSSK